MGHASVHCWCAVTRDSPAGVLAWCCCVQGSCARYPGLQRHVACPTMSHKHVMWGLMGLCDNGDVCAAVQCTRASCSDLSRASSITCSNDRWVQELLIVSNSFESSRISELPTFQPLRTQYLPSLLSQKPAPNNSRTHLHCNLPACPSVNSPIFMTMYPAPPYVLSFAACVLQAECLNKLIAAAHPASRGGCLHA